MLHNCIRCLLVRSLVANSWPCYSIITADCLQFAFGDVELLLLQQFPQNINKITKNPIGCLILHTIVFMGAFLMVSVPPFAKNWPRLSLSYHPYNIRFLRQHEPHENGFFEAKTMFGKCVRLYLISAQKRF